MSSAKLSRTTMTVEELFWEEELWFCDKDLFRLPEPAPLLFFFVRQSWVLILAPLLFSFLILSVLIDKQIIVITSLRGKDEM